MTNKEYKYYDYDSMWEAIKACNENKLWNVVSIFPYTNGFRVVYYIKTITYV